VLYPHTPARTAAATGYDERRIDELDLPRHEVVRRLRVLREPVTLFGEDDDARLARFKLVLKSGASSSC
jgi:pre-mRNA-splicing factor 18